MKTEIDFIKGCRATNNSYVVMEESLANYKAAASIQAVDTNSLLHTHTHTDNSFTNMNRRKGNGALGGGL